MEDIKLQLQSDLRRYHDPRTIALRLISKKNDTGDFFYQGDFEQDHLHRADDEDDWSYWIDDSLSWADDCDTAETSFNDSWHDGHFYEQEDYGHGWQGDETWHEWPEENNSDPRASRSRSRTE